MHCRICDEEPCMCSTASPRTVPTYQPTRTEGVDMPEEVKARIESLIGKKDMAVSQKPTVDFSAKGCWALCQHCRKPSTIHVCWCKKDLCSSCFSVHAVKCKRLQAVQTAF